MIKRFLKVQPIWLDGIVIVRILIGYMFFSYGLQIFDNDAMSGYEDWTGSLGFKPGWFWAYLGKLTELLGGACLILGLFTRFVTIPLMISMILITFMFHKGQPFKGDEHPFLLVLFSFTFFIVGPGKWSLDYLFFSGNKNKRTE